MLFGDEQVEAAPCQLPHREEPGTILRTTELMYCDNTWMVQVGCEPRFVKEAGDGTGRGRGGWTKAFLRYGPTKSGIEDTAHLRLTALTKPSDHLVRDGAHGRLLQAGARGEL